MTAPQPGLDALFPPVSHEDWRAQAELDLKGVPFEKKLVTHTYEGITIQPLYTERDWPSATDPAGFPGSGPFVRGSEPLGSSRGWDIRQEHAHPSPAENNKTIRQDLARGATSVRLRLDESLRSGQPGREELVGVGGMICGGIEDLEAALAGIDPSACFLGVDAGAAYVPAAALLAELWRRRGCEPAAARGAFNADPLGTLADLGRLHCGLEEALAQMADLAAWTTARLPRVTAVQVSTTPYHHAGATAVQDLAFSMATAVAYLRAMLERGMAPADACRQIVFSYSVGCNFFLAIAKLRAARRLWARVAESVGAPAEGRGIRMHAMTSRRILTERDPWVNMLRTTVCTAAAAIAGAQAGSAAPFDTAIGPPDEFSRRIARNTQLILQEESHLAAVIDPAGGSWYIEKLTDQLAQGAWTFFQQVEGRGGMIAALADGWAAEQINAAFAERLKNLRRRKDPITGVSEFPNVKEKPVVRAVPDLAALRKSHRERAIASRMNGARSAMAQPSDRPGGITEAACAALRTGATLAETLAAHGGGEPMTVTALKPHPFSEPFEALRTASDEYLEANGRRPRVFLANLGPIARHTGRANYAQNFFEAGGFDVLTNTGFKDAAAAAEAFGRSGAAIAVICSDDKLYLEMAVDAARALKGAGARTVLLAGNPGDNRDAWQAAGADRFIYIGCDVLETLRALLHDEGVL